MIIHNATFMVEKRLEEDVILWLKNNMPSEGVNPRISAMREAQGVWHEEADAASIAYQVEFPDIESARAFNADAFARLADAFYRRYGEQSMIFSSLFEAI